MKFRQNNTGILFALLLILFSSIALADSKEFSNFQPTVVGSAPPEYRWIEHLSMGPADTSILDDSPDGIRGKFYRLAFISNTDVFIRPIMRIDEFAYYDAGCCQEIIKSWDVDFNELEKSGIQMPRPEMSGIDSVVWLDTNTAKIRYGESECTISNIGKEIILAKCVSK